MLRRISNSQANRICWCSLCPSLITCTSNAANASDEFRFQNRVLCIDSPWAYDSNGKNVGKVFAYILAQEGHKDELVDANSAAAKEVDVHDVLFKNGDMVMEAANDFQFSHIKPLIPSPARLHLMLPETDSPLTAGSTIPVTLKFAKSETVEVDVRVVALNEVPPASDMTGAPGAMN